MINIIPGNKRQPEGLPLLFLLHNHASAMIEGLPVMRIADNAFSNCQKLISVSLPESISYIGIQAFSYCYHLEEINLPYAITAINEGIFYMCRALQ